MSADPADRTATLQPTMPSKAPARDDEPGDEAELPIDNPERYEQVAEHARGGLGRVVRAVDKRLGRTVAVKELLRQDESHESRFVREALITARLEHPGIVPVHEAGRWPNGAPYYVMKLVEGRTLKEMFAESKTLRDRLALLSHVIAIADAVGYAHSEGVIHRDLKPSNVIVGEFGETIVVDWGLARDTRGHLPEPRPSAENLLEARAKGSGASTISGKVVGTPAYMAPEQARGELVDERADVYAIGAVLYELLAGKPAYTDPTPQGVLDRVLAGPPAPLATSAPGAPPELCDIVGKAMARQPAERYANASALAEDLRRFQTGKLVSAHAYTPWQLVRKKLAQHRGVVVVAVASAIALGAVGVESFRTVVAERDIARGERERAETEKSYAEQRKRDLLFVQAETSLRKDPTAALAWLKQHPVTDRDRAQVVDVIDEALALGAARHVFRPGDWVFDAMFTPDGKTLIAAVRDGKLRAYDVVTGELRVIGQSKAGIEALAISPDGKTVVTGGSVGEVTAWSIADGTKKVLVTGGPPVMGLHFDPSGTQLLVDKDGSSSVVGLDGTVTKLGPESAVLLSVAENDWSKRVAKIAPNQAVTVDGNGQPQRVIASLDKLIQFLAVSPNADTVIVHDVDTVYAVPFAGGPLKKLVPLTSKLNMAVWAPDGKSVALIGIFHDVLLIELATGKITELKGHTDSIYTAEFTRDGEKLLTASDDGTARVWDVSDGSSVVLSGHDDDVYRARFAPDENSVATASLDGSIRVWPVDRSGARVFNEGAQDIDMSLTGDQVTIRTLNGVARWDITKGTREELFARQGLGIGVASPDGQYLVAQDADWTLQLFDRSGAHKPLRGHKGYISHVEWSQDSKYLFTSSFDGTLRRWEAGTGESTLLVEGDVPVRGFAVAKDGRVAAQVGEAAVMIKPDGTAETLGTGSAWCGTKAEFERVRDRLIIQRCDRGLLLVDGKTAVNLPTDGYIAVRIVVSADGQRIAAAMTDRTVRIWDTSGKLLSVLHGHTDLVLDVAFSPDGTELASSAYDKTIRVWELATKRYRVLRGHTRAVGDVEWHGPNELVSASWDGTIRVWPAPKLEAATQQEITKRLEAATTAEIDLNNRATTLQASPSPAGAQRL
ncbi:MAG TPA: protein kinase [Kofleriaceae bacterium]|nr:protein kinase [Kofleriaceae bacterium]